MDLPRNSQVLGYDAANKTTSLEYSVPSGTGLLKETYAFDGEGNRTSITDGAGRVASFTYDQLNRLTSETDAVTGEKRVFEYDPAGNRTRKTIFAPDGTLLSSTSYAYNQANELVSIDGAPVTHDANGNLLGLGSLTYVFDAQNRLTAVKNGSETVASFVYDGQGRRISQTTAAGTTFYHYAGDRVAYETDSTGTITRSFTYSSSGIPVSMTYQGQTYWYLVNSHGDVLRLVDSSGTVVASYRYDAWGNILESSGPLASANPYRYAGYRYDGATGLYFLNARYYNPEIGRFITRDVYLGAPPNPLTLNRYAYANGNPVNMVDPTGFGGKYVDTGKEYMAGGGGVPRGGNNARAGANAVQEMYPGSKGKTFNTSVNGGEKRIVDVYIKPTNTAIEVKSGRQSASKFVLNQINKDVDLMSQGVNVQWKFAPQIGGPGPRTRLWVDASAPFGGGDLPKDSQE